MAIRLLTLFDQLHIILPNEVLIDNLKETKSMMEEEEPILKKRKREENVSSEIQDGSASMLKKKPKNGLTKEEMEEQFEAIKDLLSCPIIPTPFSDPVTIEGTNGRAVFERKMRTSCTKTIRARMDPETVSSVITNYNATHGHTELKHVGNG